MRSVADDLRGEVPFPRRTPAENVQLALRIGDDDCRMLSAYRRISEREARAIIERQRQHGRRRSACRESVRA